MATASRQLLSRPERQRSILQAAARAFAAAGFAATSMEDVAAQAGITKLIVYRHFDSKEELYRAVLQGVSDRLAEEFLRGLSARDARGVGVRALLTVAREDPAGFILLWRHAAREPQFADYAHDHRERALRAARALLAAKIDDAVLLRWGAETVVGYLVEAVLNWLEDGSPARDEEMVELATEGLLALVQSWSGRST